MKPGLAVSAALHAALLTWGLWSLSSPKALDVSYAEALPVEIVMADTFEGVKGDKKAPVKEKPAPTPTKKPAKLPMPAENVGENEVDLDTPPVPDAKPTKVEVKQAASRSEPPPSPKPPEPVKPDPAKAEPVKPEPAKPEKVAETPPPTPTPPKVEPKAAPEPDPVEQAITDAAALPDPAPKAEPTPPKVPVPQVKPAPPKPEVAEKPAEQKPKADQKPGKTESKPEKSKDTKVADKKVAAPEKSEFNADDIASLLSKQKAAGGGAKRSTEQASLGSTKTTGTKLSRSQEGELQGLIKEQMAKCWSPPTGLEDAGSLRVLIKIHFDPSGQIDGMPEIVEGGGSAGPQRTAAEAAMRAIRRCAPFNLPADLYAGGWDVTNLNFDPSEMF